MYLLSVTLRLSGKSSLINFLISTIEQIVNTLEISGGKPSIISQRIVCHLGLGVEHLIQHCPPSSNYLSVTYVGK